MLHGNLVFPWSFLTFTVLICQIVSGNTAQKPNVIFIVADDLGWNDIGWHNSKIKSPVLTQLALQGVILNQSYVQPVCTPSRSAFMTGYYPFHTGHQHAVLWPWQDVGLGLQYKLLPEKLKELGYRTHAVGKWHLGFCNWLFTPTFRGFDSFYGFYLGSEDYYTHRRNYLTGKGLDFRHNLTLAEDDNGTYSATVFSKEAERIVKDHDKSSPLFIYLAFQSVHLPLQVPDKFSNLYPNVTNKVRKIYNGMVSALDEAVGKVVDALTARGMMNNTLIVFTTDNGGQVHGGGNNWPLRGNKATLWEGGTRGAAFVHGAGLKKTGYVNNNMIHAVDWYPTLIRLAGGDAGVVDGIDQWNTLADNATTNRTEFVYNIDEVGRSAAIRVGKYKLLLGNVGKDNGWYPEPTLPNLQPVIKEGGEESSKRQNSKLLRRSNNQGKKKNGRRGRRNGRGNRRSGRDNGSNRRRQDETEGARNRRGHRRNRREGGRNRREGGRNRRGDGRRSEGNGNVKTKSRNLSALERRERNRDRAGELGVADIDDLLSTTGYLFDVEADPTEHNNLIDVLPVVKQDLIEKLKTYYLGLHPAKNPTPSEWANPSYSSTGDDYSPGWC